MSDRRSSSSASGATTRKGSTEYPVSDTGKVPIPRLKRPSSVDGETVTSDSKQRVSHACEPCRQRKTKCSGEKPICKHCQDFNITCYYAEGKRDRARNELSMLKKKVEIYEKLLEQVKDQLDSAGQFAIASALQGNNLSSSFPYSESYANRDGESLVLADIGSTGSMDHITDNITEDNPYASGYMGKNSEVAWIQRMAQQLKQQALEDSPTQYDDNKDDDYEFKTPTYRLDDLSVSVGNGNIDPYTFPTKDIADKLVKSFFTTVYPTFPVISEELFMKQYEGLYQCYFPSSSSKRWLTMFNLVCAIGALYGKVINAAWTENDEHMNYFARARVLTLDHGSIFEVADLQQVQMLGLAGIYLIACNQINRAFNTIGLAIRYAQTLALHLRNDIPELDDVEKDLRARIWYSLYGAEHLLCCMTGRPSAIDSRDCSVPLPQPFTESQGERGMLFNAALGEIANPSSSSSSRASVAGSGVSKPPVSDTTPPLANFEDPRRYSLTAYDSYFLHHTKLNIITGKVLRELYSPITRLNSWSDVQGTISALELETTKWRANLPSFLAIQKGMNGDQGYSRQRMSLAFQYHNTRILINRPCLCRVDLRIPAESRRSKSFNRSAATTCIGAARETIALLPDEPNPAMLFSMSPWWCLYHYLVSAGVILMVEISMRAEHNPQQAEGLLNDAKKVIKWLRAMAKDDIAAERSWAVLLKLLIVSAPKIGRDISDVERDLGERKAAHIFQMFPTVHHPPQHTDPPRTHTMDVPEVPGVWPDHDVSYLFRDFLSSPFPSAHTRFDPMAMAGNQPIGSQPAHSVGPFDVDGATSGLSHNPNLVYASLPEPTRPEFQPNIPVGAVPTTQVPTTQVPHEAERFQQRQSIRRSLGTQCISLPPATFPGPPEHEGN